MTGELPGGWTLDGFAKMAQWVARTRPWLVLDREEAVDIAAVALVERVYADPPPTKADLFEAAIAAVGHWDLKERSFRGLDTNPGRSGRHADPPKYARYWYGQHVLVSPFEEQLTDRIAVRQVLAELSEWHRAPLLALAEHGNYQAARESLDLPPDVWRRRIKRARLAARTLWYAPDAPAPQWGADRPGTGYEKGIRERMRRVRAPRRERDTAA